MHSEAISVHSSDRSMSITRDQPVLIRGTQRSSVAIRGHPWQSEVISGHLRPTSAHPWPSVVISGIQRS